MLKKIGILVTIISTVVPSLNFSKPAQKQYFGQFKQDQIVNERFFHNKRNGVFVDIGASDGITDSNTYFFEKNLGWKGICVEPLKSEFDKLKARRNCITLQGCIGSSAGKAQFVTVLNKDGQEIGLSGLLNSYPSEHLENIKKSFNIKIVEMPIYRLNDVCKAHNIASIDYLSIDTEGAELEILKSINFSLLDIDVIDLENNFNNPAIREFLESKGYKFILRVGVDDIYRKIKHVKNEL